MKCDRCGRDNPGDLRFCQDCGNRLQAPAPAAVATPPRALVADAGGDAPRPRPQAPAFNFAPKPADQEISCTRCGAQNPSEARFCAECGVAVGAADAGGGAAAVAGAPVVGVAAPQPAQTDIVCGRCRGKNEPHMAYCQYCGARLGDPAQPETGGGRAGGPAVAAPAPAPAHNPVPEVHRPEREVAERAPQVTGRYAPPPQAAPAARLVVIAQDGSPGREYALAADQSDIGREGGQIQLPNDPYVSPLHARITARNGRYYLRDLGSTNGVYLRLRGPAALEHGDLVLVGLEVLRFEVVNDAEKGFGPAVDQGTHVFGSPATPRFARLRQHTVEGVGRDIYYVCREETVIGRENGDIVFTADPFMSRRHASITRNVESASFSLRDLGSSNGTFLALRQERALEDGDHVRIGQHLFRIELQPGARV